MEKTMNAFKYKCGLYLGRFQPLHKGHAFVISRMFCDCENVIIAVGSAQEEGTIRNPLSYSFRERLIRRAYGYYDDRLTIVPIRDRDVYSDDSSWGDYLLKQISEYTDLKPDVIFEGDEDTNAHWYDNLNIKVIKIPRKRIRISGTELRKAFIEDRRQFVVYHMPFVLHNYYDEIRKEIQNAAANSKCNPVD
jgi:nicotinamide-nucleotide adenylyltransferase